MESDEIVKEAYYERMRVDLGLDALKRMKEERLDSLQKTILWLGEPKEVDDEI